MKARHAVALGGLLLAIGAQASTTTASGKVWITLDERAYALLGQVDPSAHSLESRYMPNGISANGQSTMDKVHIVQVDKNVLGALGERIHRVLHHCAGYVTYDSLQAAQVALQPQTALATFTRPDYQITHNALLQPMLGQAAASGITQTIQDLSAFQNRYYNGDYGAQASDWLRDKWQGMASSRADISVEQVRRGTDKQPSVVLTIKGNEHPDQVLVLGAHLDTVDWQDATSVNDPRHATLRAPGADDDASGVASLTEALRVMLANGYKPQRTIKLMAYSGEEFGLYGSNYIAADYASRNVDVVGMLQLDMTNYKGSAGDIYLMDDYTDAQQNQFVENLATTYQPTLKVMHDRCGYGCSDHYSWNSQGYPASMPFESAMHEYSPYIHSSNDTYANSGNQADHALKFARLALSFAVELGDVSGDGDTDPPGGDNGNVLQNGVPLTGLSAAAKNQAAYTVTIPAGASNLVISTSGGTGDVDMYTRFGSAPTTGSYDCRPYKNGNSESCTVAAPKAGVYHVMLDAYAAYAGVSLKASWTTGAPSTGGVFSNADDLAIPDSGSVTSRITVSGRSGNAPAALKVAVKAVHSYAGDLRLTLTGPNGASKVLKNPDGSDRSRDLDTSYTVDASAMPANGDWTLKVDDVYQGDTGHLDQWSLAF